MARDAGMQTMIDNITDNPPRTVDGEWIVANATFHVVADLGTRKRLADALAAKKVRRVRLENGTVAYVFTLKGYLDACREIIKNARQEARKTLRQMKRKRSQGAAHLRAA